jgi:hypothetical protein
MAYTRLSWPVIVECPLNEMRFLLKSNFKDRIIILVTLFGVTMLWGCASQTQDTQSPALTPKSQPTIQSTTTPTMTVVPPTPTATPVESTATALTASEPIPGRATEEPLNANVLSVEVTGEPQAYTFSVQVSSPDTGCQQYADWWEVVSLDGELLYRRILLHSHAGEQPFTRSGGPVSIQADTQVWVRAHMNTGGYGGQALKGSPQSGFQAAQPAANFAKDLENQPPLPEDCAF